MARRNRSSIRKERIIMLASSVFVLAALTVTGVYVRNNNRAEKEDYVVDFEALEQGSTELAENMMSGEELDTLFAGVGTDDLDYDPSFQEANSLHVENIEDGVKSGKKKTIEEGIEEKKKEEDLEKKKETESDQTKKDEKDEKGEPDKPEKDDPVEKSAAGKKTDGADQGKEEEEAGMFDESVDTVLSDEVQAEAISTTVQPELDFSEEDGLVWPIVGDVLINYSMDQTIYFPTLKQYKYNPGILISGEIDMPVVASHRGEVIGVSHNEELGNYIQIDVGNGFTTVYGQLKDIPWEEGQIVDEGVVLGYIEQPTKYYSSEGAHVFFEMRKGENPINPLDYLE